MRTRSAGALNILSPGFDVECRVKLGQIGHDVVGPVLAGAVRVGQQAAPQFVIAVFARPALGPADEETLLARYRRR